ncbi:MAG TPA: PQQ-binding-like beta-propeller repeat protein [Vicinamibacterales bacterium]|nr:PQQ-binding-like beta-propeller repeat protein [Vicinamibacterales bacterium]
MLRRILKVVAFSVLALVLAGAVLFAFGLRIVLDGGGSPHLRFVPSDRAQLEAIARHREAQRSPSPQPATAADPPADREPPAAPPPPADTPAAGPAAARPDPPTRRAFWTDFRGPRRDGHYTERSIETAWPARGLVPIWKQPVGGGYASFAVAHGRAFTIEQRGDEEVAAAYDVATGRELWTNRWKARFSELMGGPGPRATPTWFDGHVYVLGGDGELRCLDDGDGRLVWRTNILEDAGATNLQWGMSASPLIVDDTVVVLPGGSNNTSVVAYDRRTGAQAWAALPDRQSYSSPMLVTIGGVRQVLVFSASRLMGLTPDRGQVLWEYPWTTQPEVNASQPLLIGDNRVFVSTGYGTGAAVIELTRTDGRFDVREVWRNIRMKNQFTSSVLHEGFIYGLDEAILACVDAATGELKWKGGRYGYGQVLLASGHLIVLTEAGELALVRATPDRHVELARFPVLDGKGWNHPAMADGYLLVRTDTEMAGFDLRPGRRSAR